MASTSSASHIRSSSEQQLSSARPAGYLPGHHSTASSATIATSQPHNKSTINDSLYNPHQKQVNASCFDFLVIEIVPLAMRIVDEIREQQQQQQQNKPETTSAGATPGNPKSIAEGDDDVYFRVEQYGYRLGRGLAEVFTRERGRFANQLDVMKFICKELWPLVFKKQIDNLKTNHRGTYVLIDLNFTMCQRMSTSLSPQATVKQAMPYLWFPMGLIRGSLAALGVEASLSFESNQLPSVSFNIHTTR